MWLLLFLTIFFSALSTSMMNYLVMQLPLGPWVGPLFVVVCMVCLIPIVSRKWFQDHAIVTICAGSIGGMVGLGLGMTVPSFYFLYPGEFLIWLQHPIQFAGVISLLVLCAGAMAFLIAYVIKDHLIVDELLPFPMSKVVYDIVSVDRYSDMHRLMWTGIGISSVWNLMLIGCKTLMRVSMMSYHMIPMLLALGFVAGDLITVPIIIGLINRMFAIRVLRIYFDHIHDKEFLILFCLGMLFVYMVHSAVTMLIQYFKNNDASLPTRLKLHMKNPYIVVLFMTVLGMSSAALHLLGVGWYEQLLVFPLLCIIGFNIAKLVGEVGVVSIDGFVWCFLLILMYACTAVLPLNLLLVALFVSVCLGMVIDLTFSYKLAHLAGVAYRRILTYQLVGFSVAVVLSGIIMWYYAQSFDHESLKFLAFQAQDLDALINFGSFNYQLFLCGMAAGLLILLAGQRLLVVIGATLFAPTEGVCLIVAGLLTYFVADRKKYFPLCFGMYASHALWMMLWAIMYHKLL